ncbi:hypothetical protein [Desulfovibrio gilichinskyi]|uniref:Secreted protein n=1 Tax=Desulfovibrio gilichinskyi TaxID=1519643 RepID=A0A1X7CH40_9BACT|nr:hypothetical protein [Desulfovibrio gilichinskyi]SME96187.1 hypothetical protein SAMN06295933_0869 [Desulfovibrio gilichinskyi]
MKRLIKAYVLSLAMLMLVCGTAGADDFNAQGSALVPGIEFGKHGGFSLSSALYLSNITNETIRCRVCFYDHDGNDMSSRIKIRSGSSASWQIILAAGTGEADIPAHSTRIFSLETTNNEEYRIGHAYIQWSSSDPKPHKALIGLLRNAGGNSIGLVSAHSQINNGQPF